MKLYIKIGVFSFFLIACNNTGKKDSVEIADSINKARIDTAINKNVTTIDEGSASFLVDAANSSMAEIDLGALATQKASSQRVKDFGSMMLSDHAATTDQAKLLAAQKNIKLPDSISAVKRKEIDNLKTKNKAAFDKAFMDHIVKSHEAAIQLFEKALTEAKDPEINSFADRTLMKLRKHLDSAKAVRLALK
jgi:putative membrane protein